MNDSEIDSADIEKIRILVVGPAATGKTAIIKKYLYSKFSEIYAMTMGGEVLVKLIDHDGKKVDLIINDLPGENRFKVARESFYPGASGALLVFDLTRYTTYNPGLFERLKELWENSGKIPTIVIGNKKDLADEGYRSIKKEDILNYCGKIPCDYIETSAKDGTGIKEAFNTLIDKILKDSKD